MKKLFISFCICCVSLYANDGSNSNTLESNEDKVIINNIPLAYKVSIDGSNSRFISDLLDARVTLRNKDLTRHHLEYKFVWYDISGFETASYMSKWKRVRIDAKDTIIVKSLAITPKIDSFKFYVRGIKN